MMSTYSKSTSYGAASYVGNIQFDKDTGEIKETEKKLFLDEDKIKQEEELDGYYAIVTSELDEADDKIIEMYRGLWKIEESFKVTKTDLEARPVYVKTKEHINAHFLICFIALLIGRITELRLKNKYTIGKIQKTLKEVNCSLMDSNHYLFSFANSVTDDINNEFEVNIGKKVMSLGEIKKNFAKGKKR